MKNKKIITLLIALLVVTMALPVFAENHEEEGADAAITGGMIEFDTTIFSSDTNKESGVNNTDQTTGNTIDIPNGSHELIAEFTGEAFLNFDWTLNMELNGDEDSAANLALARNFEDGLVEVSADIDATENQSFWDAINDNLKLKGKRNVGKVEAQAVANIDDTINMVQDTDTYIKYNFTDDLTTTFKPYDVEFMVGNEFETEIGEDTPGVATTYETGALTVDGVLGTQGTYQNNITDDGSEESTRKIQLEGEATYDLGAEGSVTGGILVNSMGEATKFDKDAKELTDSGSLDGVFYSLDNPALNFVLNTNTEYNLSDELTLTGEFNYGTGSYTEETVANNNVETTTDLARTDLGLYAKASMDLDMALVYGSYKFERVAVEDNYASIDNGYLATDETKITDNTNTILLGAEKDLEDGVTLIAEFETAPSSIETDYVDNPSDNNESVAMMLTTKVKYEF